ncbi:MAG TPA: PH domain-containing protein [Polyangia bacterium]|nr:PH domain-containing protein [Polyangia bacterium]
MPLVSCPDCGRQVSTAAAACPQCNRPLGPQAVAPPVAAVPAAEEVAWEGAPSVKAMLGDITRTALFAIGLPIVAAVGFSPFLSVMAGLGRPMAETVAANRSTLQTVFTVAVVVLVLARLARLGWHVAVLRSHRYRVSNQRILLESGVLSKRIDEVDMRTIEDIEFQQGVLERMLGIGEIAIIAADKRMGRFRLLGVENPRDVRELIRANAFQATQRQLFTRST